MGVGRRVMVLRPEDQHTMRTFGLDPENKEHVRAFVRQRRERPEAGPGGPDRRLTVYVPASGGDDGS